MFKDIVVEVNGQEIPLHLCFTTHGTFVSIKITCVVLPKV